MPSDVVISQDLCTCEAVSKVPASLVSRGSVVAPAREQRRILEGLELTAPDVERVEFLSLLEKAGLVSLSPMELEYFQINMGKLCNMACRHCHVDAGPDRSDAVMQRDTVDACLRAIEHSTAHTVDLTGGAPELNPHFEFLVDSVRRAGRHVIDRCNLTVLLLPRFEHYPQWLADRGVEIVCSLPHFRQRNTDAQRGTGTFERSLEALRRLNAVGYGTGDVSKVLTVMTNPAGAFLAGDQSSLERDWKRALERDHGITFDRLISLNNMPLGRFLEWLAEGRDTMVPGYVQRLVDAFNPAAVSGIMCRNTISVSWDGWLYDCDFNQVLDLPARPCEGREAPVHVKDFDGEAWKARQIVTRRHCFGCTAGSGSSCGGATT